MVGPAGSEQDPRRPHISFPHGAEEGISVPAAFPPKQTPLSSGGRQGKGRGLFSVVSGIPRPRNHFKAGHGEVTNIPRGPV